MCVSVVKEMPKLVKLAPNGSTDRSPFQQETKKRKRPIGKSHALVTSKPLTIGKLRFVLTYVFKKNLIRLLKKWLIYEYTRFSKNVFDHVLLYWKKKHFYRFVLNIKLFSILYFLQAIHVECHRVLPPAF